MNFRFHIMSFIILSYSLLLVHEVAYGHHLSLFDENFHHHGNHAQEGDHSGDSSPCFFKLNPHLTSSFSFQPCDLTDNKPYSPESFMGLNPADSGLTVWILLFISPQKEPGIPAFPKIRGHQLRGPPQV